MSLAATGQQSTTCASTSPRELFALRGSCEHRGFVPLRGLRGGCLGLPYPEEIKIRAAQFKPQPGTKFSRDDLTRAQFYDNHENRVAPQLWLSLFGLIDHPGVELRANLKLISHRCYLFDVAFVWELTIKIIVLPLSCIQSG